VPEGASVFPVPLCKGRQDKQNRRVRLLLLKKLCISNEEIPAPEGALVILILRIYMLTGVTVQKVISLSFAVYAKTGLTASDDAPVTMYLIIFHQSVLNNTRGCNCNSHSLFINEYRINTTGGCTCYYSC